MTKVYIAQEGDMLILSVQGHATGSAEACAAVSGIVCALAGYALNEAINAPTLRLADGDAYIACRVSGKLRAAYKMAAIGLMQIGESTGLVEVEENL